MTKRELEERVKQLEARIAALEARPVYVPIPALAVPSYVPPSRWEWQQPYSPNYPMITCGTPAGATS